MRSIKVQDCMTRHVITFLPTMEVVEAIRILLQQDITAAPVVDTAGTLLGILSEMNCLQGTLMGGYFSQEGGLVSEHMTQEVVTVHPQDDIISVYAHFRQDQALRVAVVEAGKLVGILSPKDVMAAVLEFYEKPTVQQSS